MQVPATRKENDARFFGWWYALAVPRTFSETASFQEREFIRRAQFTSIVLLIQFFQALVIISIGINDRTGFIPVIISALVTLVGLFLNRAGKTRIAGILAFATSEIGMVMTIVGSSLPPATGLSSIKALQLTLLIQPELIAVSLFPLAVSLSLGLFNCLFSAAVLALFPRR